MTAGPSSFVPAALDESATADVVLAVDEVATNGLVPRGGAGPDPGLRTGHAPQPAS